MITSSGDHMATSLIKMLKACIQQYDKPSWVLKVVAHAPARVENHTI